MLRRGDSDADANVFIAFLKELFLDIGELVEGSFL
jgi:hypothetical protein